MRNGRRAGEVARGEAEAAMRAREDFAAAVAHDLKSTLTAISMTAQLARRRLERPRADMQAEIASNLADIEASALNIASRLDELLDLVHLEARRALRLNLAPARLLAIVETVQAEHEVRDGRRTFHVVAAADPEGSWDAVRLIRVVDNLCWNAIGLSPAGGDIVIEVTEEQQSDGRLCAVLSVRFQGSFAPADLERVFDGAFTAERIKGSTAPRMTLGGARQIVEQHGGTLTAASATDARATFVLRLPLVRTPHPWIKPLPEGERV